MRSGDEPLVEVVDQVINVWPRNGAHSEIGRLEFAAERAVAAGDALLLFPKSKERKELWYYNLSGSGMRQFEYQPDSRADSRRLPQP